MSDTFDHLELTTADPRKAQKFYGKVFDWKFETMKGMDYTMIRTSKGAGGGIMASQSSQQPTAWMPYVTVANLEQTLKRAQKAGAKVVLAPQEVGGGMGSIAVFVDPTGAALGLFEEAAAPPPAKKAAAKPTKPTKGAKPSKATKPAKAVKAAAKPAKAAAKPAKKTRRK